MIFTLPLDPAEALDANLQPELETLSTTS